MSMKPSGKARPPGRPPPPAGKAAPPSKAAPPGKAPPAKAAGQKDAAGLPSWQGPKPSDDWKTDRIVNWQPIRQADRWTGSVWEQVHTSMKGSAALPPDSLLSRFMRKADEVRPAHRSSNNAQASKLAVRRVLSKRMALIADINHALLVRKGIRDPRQLQWVLGPIVAEGAEPSDEQPAELSEEILEALQGLLSSAVGEEANLRDARRKDELVRVEAFLLELVTRFGSLEGLQARVDTALNMSRFPTRAEGVAEELRVALGAVSSVMNSSAVPVLLEGVLLLGNSVNSSSRQLGGAVGVTLESLAKLAHTRCLPPGSAAQGSTNGQKNQTENALHVLVMHLAEKRPQFAETLACDLDPCHAARDFDPTSVSDVIKDLSTQIHSIRCRAEAAEGKSETSGTVDAMAPERLWQFLDGAMPKLVDIKELQKDLEEATVAMRRWFAEPAESSLQGMLRSLASLREALPAHQPVKKDAVRKGLARGMSRSNHPRERATGKASVSTDGQKQSGAEAETCLVSTPSHEAPFQVVVQILSFKEGRVWLSWMFDWDNIPAGLTGSERAARSFEVVQRCTSKPDDVLRWPCSHSPVKIDVPVGFCYEFEIRALLKCEEGSSLSGQDGKLLWASKVSAPVLADLKGGHRQADANGDLQHMRSKLAHSADGPRRKSSVASSIGAFLGGMQASSLQATGEPQHALPVRSDGARDLPPRRGSEPFVNATSERLLDEANAAVPVEVEDDLAGHSPSAASGTTAAVSIPADNVESTTRKPESPSKLVIEPSFDDDFLLRLSKALSNVERTIGSGSVETDASECAFKTSLTADARSQVKESLAAEARLPEVDRQASSETEQEIADMDDDSLRYLARALSTLDGFITEESGHLPAEAKYLGRALSSADDGSTQEPESRRGSTQTLSSDLSSLQPHVSRCAAELTPEWTSSTGTGAQYFSLSRSTTCELPDGNEVLAAMQRKFSSDSQPLTFEPAERQGTSRDEEGLSAKVRYERDMMQDGLQDGNAVLAAMEAKFNASRQCKLCNGSGKAGLLGANGLGMFKKQCTACQAAGISAQAAAASPAAPSPYYSSSQPVQRLSAAPMWAAPPPMVSKRPKAPAAAVHAAPVTKLNVNLADGKVQALEVSGKEDLSQLVKQFVKQHHLKSLFEDSLLDVLERMLASGIRERSVDIVDLV